jgi:ABC-type sugar transport system ATPase subunit
MEVESITIKGGYDKFGNKEKIEEITIHKGEIFCIIGPTGSGKTSIISDIEQIAQCDTFSKRRTLFDGKVPDKSIRTDPRRKLVAQLSQKMNFLADMQVDEFILLHSKCRGIKEDRVNQVVDLANTLTGEPISRDCNITIGPCHRIGNMKEEQFEDIGVCMVEGFIGIVDGKLPKVGRTIRFVPEGCMMQKVHSGIVVQIEGDKAIIEGIA